MTLGSLPACWPRLAVATLLAAMLFGLACGGIGSRSDSVGNVVLVVQVTPVYTPLPTATVFPTFTPVPVGKPSIGADLPNDSTVVTAGAVAAGGRSSATGPSASGLSCGADLRVRLAGHYRRVYVEDVELLLRTLRAERPDCSDERWPVQVSGVATCLSGGTVGGAAVANQLLDDASRQENLLLGPTREDPWGNLLIHFKRLPDTGAPGCWYYSQVAKSWHTRIETSAEPTALAEIGVGTNCDEELRHLLAAQPTAADATALGLLVLEVQNGVPGCQRLAWDPAVARSGDGRCGAGPSVVSSGGLVRVYWRHDSRPADGATCWVYQPDTDDWTADGRGLATANVGGGG